MDDQQTREFGTDREGIKSAPDTTTGQRDNPLENRTQQNSENRWPQDNQNTPQDTGQTGGTIEQARTMARNVGEQAWSAATNAGSAAQDLARRAREQTSGVIDPLYQQGARAGEYVTRNINDYPLATLLIAGAVGYGLAYLIHGQWQRADG